MALGSPPMAFMLLHPALENVQVMRLDVITASTAALHSRASSGNTRGFHTQLHEGTETP